MVYYVVLFNKLKHIALKRKPYLITYTYKSLKMSVEMLKHILVASGDELVLDPTMRMEMLGGDKDAMAHPMKFLRKYCRDDVDRALKYIHDYNILKYVYNGR